MHPCALFFYAMLNDEQSGIILKPEYFHPIINFLQFRTGHVSCSENNLQTLNKL